MPYLDRVAILGKLCGAADGGVSAGQGGPVDLRAFGALLCDADFIRDRFDGAKPWAV